MIFHWILIFLYHWQGQLLTWDDLNDRFSSMESKINRLESEVQTLKSKNDELEMKIELKEVQADVSYLMMEQVKLNDRIRFYRTWETNLIKDYGRLDRIMSFVRPTLKRIQQS